MSEPPGASPERADEPGHERGDEARGALRDLPGALALAQIGATIAGLEAIGVGAGLWVDHLTHASPAGLLIGIVLGTVAAALSVSIQVRRYL